MKSKPKTNKKSIKKKPAKKQAFSKSRKKARISKRRKSVNWSKKLINKFTRRKDKKGNVNYEMFFNDAPKNEFDLIDGIGQALVKSKLKLGKEFIKLTFVAKEKNEIQGLSYLYDIDKRKGLEEAIEHMLSQLFRQRINKNTPGYMKRMQRMSARIIKMEIQIQ